MIVIHPIYGHNYLYHIRDDRSPLSKRGWQTQSLIGYFETHGSSLQLLFSAGDEFKRNEKKGASGHLSAFIG